MMPLCMCEFNSIQREMTMKWTISQNNQRRQAIIILLLVGGWSEGKSNSFSATIRDFKLTRKQTVLMCRPTRNKILATLLSLKSGLIYLSVIDPTAHRKSQPTSPFGWRWILQPIRSTYRQMWSLVFLVKCRLQSLCPFLLLPPHHTFMSKPWTWNNRNWYDTPIAMTTDPTMLRYCMRWIATTDVVSHFLSLLVADWRGLVGSFGKRLFVFELE